MSTVETSTPNTLLFDKAYIDGQWVSAKSGKTFSVTNPATGESIADVADMDQQDAALAIAAADCAFQTWQKSLAKDRYAILMR